MPPSIPLRDVEENPASYLSDAERKNGKNNRFGKKQKLLACLFLEWLMELMQDVSFNLPKTPYFFMMVK